MNKLINPFIYEYWALVGIQRDINGLMDVLRIYQFDYSEDRAEFVEATYYVGHDSIEQIYKTINNCECWSDIYNESGKQWNECCVDDNPSCNEKKYAPKIFTYEEITNDDWGNCVTIRTVDELKMLIQTEYYKQLLFTSTNDEEKNKQGYMRGLEKISHQIIT